MSDIKKCTTLAQVRQHIDLLDEQVVALLAQRSAYVAQAACIKSSVNQIVDQERIEFIINRVRAQARQAGAPEAVLEATYRAMIAAFIVFEHAEFERLYTGS